MQDCLNFAPRCPQQGDRFFDRAATARSQSSYVDLKGWRGLPEAPTPSERLGHSNKYRCCC
jgi:hypothetical protein